MSGRPRCSCLFCIIQSTTASPCPCSPPGPEKGRRGCAAESLAITHKFGGRAQDTLVIDEWLLLEYAVCFLPANQDALVESVSKGRLGLPDDFLNAIGVDAGLLV